ncbi:hypothetical protein CSUI_004253 [Cystoisospora suis]|uniref:Uncharacterized protein n=1 Tax=Cystoisospora suis TaxID=483139 RepID=A0A2C6L168_9APIC|nr:hypothetical protein CSUI_004253 [Cystoisospora suis]
MSHFLWRSWSPFSPNTASVSLAARKCALVETGLACCWFLHPSLDLRLDSRCACTSRPRSRAGHGAEGGSLASSNCSPRHCLEQAPVSGYTRRTPLCAQNAVYPSGVNLHASKATATSVAESLSSQDRIPYLSFFVCYRDPVDSDTDADDSAFPTSVKNFTCRRRNDSRHSEQALLSALESSRECFFLPLSLGHRPATASPSIAGESLHSPKTCTHLLLETQKTGSFPSRRSVSQASPMLRGLSMGMAHALSPGVITCNAVRRSLSSFFSTSRRHSRHRPDTIESAPVSLSLLWQSEKQRCPTKPRKDHEDNIHKEGGLPRMYSSPSSASDYISEDIINSSIDTDAAAATCERRYQEWERLELLWKGQQRRGVSRTCCLSTTRNASLRLSVPTSSPGFPGLPQKEKTFTNTSAQNSTHRSPKHGESCTSRMSSSCRSVSGTTSTKMSLSPSMLEISGSPRSRWPREVSEGGEKMPPHTAVVSTTCFASLPLFFAGRRGTNRRSPSHKKTAWHQRLGHLQAEALIRMKTGPYPPFLEPLPLSVLCRMLTVIWSEEKGDNTT